MRMVGWKLLGGDGRVGSCCWVGDGRVGSCWVRMVGLGVVVG